MIRYIETKAAKMSSDFIALKFIKSKIYAYL